MDEQKSCRDDEPASTIPTDLFAWPALMAAVTGRAVAASIENLMQFLPTYEAAPTVEPVWTTPHDIKLELTSMRLRDFSSHGGGTATLICAPYALHGACVVDFAPRHSLVEALREGGLGRVHVTDWRSADAEMRFLSIDSLMADLNVAVDELRPPVDLVGMCQGGWMALAYAARFPGKVRRLVLVGAPIDLAAAPSMLATATARVPQAAFEEFVRSQGGRVLGRLMLQTLGSVLNASDEKGILQIADDKDPQSTSALFRRFREWSNTTVDLPGTYYLQAVAWIFRENRLVTARFPVLGHRVDLAAIDQPMFLLAAQDDEIVATEQLFATATYVRTPKHMIETAVAPGVHLSLFMGAETLQRVWPRIARWLNSEHLSQAT